MGDQAKAARTAAGYNEQSICPLCKVKDSQQHWIRECQESALPISFPKTLPKTRSDNIAQVEVDIRREKRDKHEKTARWTEIILDIAVKHPQQADVRVGMWPPILDRHLNQDFKTAATTIPHGNIGHSGGSTRTNTNYQRDSHRLTGILTDSQQEEATHTANKQLHCTYEPTSTIHE